MTIVDGHTSGPQLIRFPYQSKATGEARQFLVYLPVDYDTQQAYRWPIIFFLHGGANVATVKPIWTMCSSTVRSARLGYVIAICLS
jgi:predicted peptidase